MREPQRGKECCTQLHNAASVQKHLRSLLCHPEKVKLRKDLDNYETVEGEMKRQRAITLRETAFFGRVKFCLICNDELLSFNSRARRIIAKL